MRSFDFHDKRLFLLGVPLAVVALDNSARRCLAELDDIYDLVRLAGVRVVDGLLTGSGRPMR